MADLSETEMHIEALDEGFFRNNEEEILRDNCDRPGDEMVWEDNEVIVPEVGMKFKDVTEIFDFYKRYAYNVGFPVKRRDSKKDNDGVVNYVKFSCSREGKRSTTSSNSSRPQATVRIGCKAKLTATSDGVGIWRINSVYLEHNHNTSPSKSRLFRCNRQLNAKVKRQLEVNDVAGISLHKSYNSLVVESGGYEQMTCIERDCRNYVQKVRRLRLGEGDAAAMQSYFSKMQANCPGFFFNIDLDEECRVRNVFWADNRCREAYKEFGDVVTFDTTYLTNKYEMPFAPFVGVNHHGQSMLFGCGLLSNEDTETFVWLFSTWLQCMQGKAPNGIITDQDRAMTNAIKIVFPNTKHRWCLWHILKKLPEKFGNHAEKGAIFSAIHGLVYDSQTQQEFEQGWSMMVKNFELDDNDWLTKLYIERACWVPCYLKISFWAGMSTTQRSEGINAFFDGFVHSKTTLKQFVEQYEQALKNKVEKEFQADFQSFSQMVPCITPYDLEKQFQSVYTIKKFREFQEEISRRAYCRFISVTEGHFGTTYEIEEDVIVGEGVKWKKFSLLFQRESCDFVCSCHLFEFRGIICRHAISVLTACKVRSVPDKYILKRWRRDVIRCYTRVGINYDGWINSPRQLRYDKLCKALTNVAYLASNVEEHTVELMKWLQVKEIELSTPNSCSRFSGLSQSTYQFSNSGATMEDTFENILDPICSSSKGRPKKLRKKGPLETLKKAKVSLSSNKIKKVPRNNQQTGAVVHQTTQEAQDSYMMPLLYPQRLMTQNDTQAVPSVQPLQFPTLSLRPPYFPQHIPYGDGCHNMHDNIPYMQQKDGTGST